MCWMESLSFAATVRIDTCFQVARLVDSVPPLRVDDLVGSEQSHGNHHLHTAATVLPECCSYV